MDHIRDLLSPYIDGALSAEERSRAEGHLSSCADCRRELSELRAASRMVASLPKAEPPPGFLARLERRRAGGAKPAWTPSPARLAAFAAAGIVVFIVVRQEKDLRRQPFFAGEQAQSLDVLGPENKKAKEDASPAELPGGGRQYTNEELQDHLDKERDRIGIRSIAPRGEEARGQATLPDRPMTKDEAMAHMRTMTSEFERMNRRRQAQEAPPVALEGVSARLLARADEGGAPVDREPAAPAAGGSMSFLKAGKAVRGAVLQPTGFEEAEPAARSWSGVPLERRAASRVARTQSAWAQLRREAGLEGAPALLDFSREMAVAVFSPAGRPNILSAAARSGRFVVSYRLAGSEAGYHILVVPATDLPVAFERAR